MGGQTKPMKGGQTETELKVKQTVFSNNRRICQEKQKK